MRRSWVRALALAAAMALLACGCGARENQDTPRGTGWESLSPQCLNEFSLALFKQLKDEPDNVLITPWSVAMTVGTIRLGASGETAAQLNDVLGCWGVEEDALPETFRQLNALFTGEALPLMEDTRAIYVAQGPTVREQYARLLRQVFEMEVNLVDFTDPVTLELINDWVGRVTEGRVDRILEELPRDANTLLIDNILCNLTWKQAFDPGATSPQAFSVDGGAATVTSMMYALLEAPRCRSAGVDAVFLPLSATGCEVWVLVPSADNTLSGLVASLTMENLIKWREDAVTAPTNVFIPTMELTYNADLLGDVAALGAPALLGGPDDESTVSDLAAMGSGLVLSQLRHRTQFALNEQGALEAVPVKVGTPYLAVREKDSFVANRSFAFLVVDWQNRSILFTGTYRHP